MAMTKKERAEFDAALLEARTVGALRWTSPVLPDVSPQNGSIKLATGYLYNAHSPSVAAACSSSIHHAYGRNDKTTTRGSRWLYSSKLRALMAMRHEVERESADKLRKIDELIAKERAFGTDA